VTETLPLQGIRVLDFGTAWAGPAIGEILSDLGAEVIKIESRTKLDGMRVGRPMVGDVIKGDAGNEPELQPIFHSLNRGKKSLTIDFKTPEGLKLLRDLVVVSDVTTDNFSPGVLDRAGIGYLDLVRLKPDIIVQSMSGAGATGPLANIVAYAPTTTALSGTTSLVGTEDGRNVMPQRGYGDANAAIHAAIAILLALHHREQTGRGQWIDVGEVETASVLLGEPFADYFMNGRVATPRGTYHPAMSPHNIYPSEGDDAWVAIAVTSDQEWRSFCAAIGKPDIADQPAFADAVQRVRNRKELDGIVSAWTRQKTPRDAADALQAAGVAAEPVMNAHDHYFDPGFNHRKAWVEVEHPILGNITLPAVPWRLSDTPCKITNHAPTLGQHNGYVCRDLLGVPQERVDDLAAKKVLQ